LIYRAWKRWSLQAAEIDAGGKAVQLHNYSSKAGSCRHNLWEQVLEQEWPHHA
jgi:hypothetical protein